MMDSESGKAGRWVRFALLAVLALVIGGFSLFVGYMKATAPMDVLAAHNAWTAHLPVPLGRTLGVLEIAAAATLILSLVIPALARAGLFAAIWIALNHSVAAAVHVAHAETMTYSQSAVMISLCGILIALAAARARGRSAVQQASYG